MFSRLGPLVAVLWLSLVSLPGMAQGSVEATQTTDDSAPTDVDDALHSLRRDVAEDARRAIRAQADEPPSDEPTGDDASATLAEIEAALAEDLETTAESPRAASGATPVQSMNPDISLILDTTAAWFSHDDVDLRGGHDPSAFGFNLQGLELAIGAAVDPYFRFDSAILFALYGVEIEEAYVTSLALPWGLQLRAGQFKTPIGRLNPTHVHSWHFVTQALVNGKFFGGESLRGLGVELSRLLPTPWYAEALISVQNISGAATGRSFAPSPDAIDGPLDLTLNARLEQFFELSTNLDLLVGLGWAVGQNHSGPQNFTDLYVGDLLLRWRDVTAGGQNEVGWQTEVMLRRRQLPLNNLQDVGGSTFVYYSPSKFLEFATRYEFVSGIDPDTSAGAVDPLDPAWTGPRHRAAVNTSWTPSHFSRVRLEYQLDHRGYLASDDRSALDHQVFLQLEVVAGAHGAHDY